VAVGRERLTERELQILDGLAAIVPAGLPRVEVVHDIREEEKICPHDGTVLVRSGEETSEQFHFIPATMEVLKLSAKGVKPVIAQAYGLKCRSLVGRFLFDKVMFHACPGCLSKHFLPADDSAADLRTGHLELHAGIGATFNVLDV